MNTLNTSGAQGAAGLAGTGNTTGSVGKTTREVAVLGGGCFWCIEPVFTALRGVIEVVPGYCGGHVENPSYEQVCDKNTGHVEVIRVTFDPGIISYETLLQVFFATHNPTTLDRQGNDVGPQYASVIFYQSESQRKVAELAMAQAEALWEQPVVTRLLPAAQFWEAEEYHHDYYAKHPEQGYCQVVIAPKVSKFRQSFKELLTR